MANKSIVQDVRESLLKFDELIVVSHGRPLDSALSSAKETIKTSIACIDPPNYNGDTVDSNETAQVAISWLKLDDVDSNADKELNQAEIESMEEIVENCKSEALRWLSTFKTDYKKRYSVGSWNGIPAFRVKHLVTGFVLTFSVTYKGECLP